MNQFFMKHCPICGRPLQIADKYKNSQVSCVHCRGSFVADSTLNETESLMERATRLLARVELLLNLAKRPMYDVGSQIDGPQPIPKGEVYC
ncbi:MAG TPA: hypothetical protein VIH42_00595 [Thermoguttaceae bacterium]